MHILSTLGAKILTLMNIKNQLNDPKKKSFCLLPFQNAFCSFQNSSFLYYLIKCITWTLPKCMHYLYMIFLKSIALFNTFFFIPLRWKLQYYYRTCLYSIWHSTQHWVGKTRFHPCGFLVEVMSDLELLARCPLCFHHAPLKSTQIHQFALKIDYESIKSSIWNPLIIHYTHIQVEMVH